jgi:predicted RNA-binding protein with PUA-like domain
MAYWLVKSEPDAWSWEQQVKKGAKGEVWSGVRNHTAKRNLMNMKKGDRAFFYHSNIGKEIVGIVEVIREHYPDPTDRSGKFVAVDVKALAPLPQPESRARAEGHGTLEIFTVVGAAGC